MRKSRKHTEITVETETLIVVHCGAGARRSWCESCGAARLMLTPPAAARLAGVSTRLIYARIEAGLVHYTELSGGALLVCGASVGLNQT